MKSLKGVLTVLVVLMGLVLGCSHPGSAMGLLTQDQGEDEYTPGKWGFPSDHLPVVVDVNFDGRVAERFVTFNLLNEDFKPYIRKGQGLTGSALDEMNEADRIRLLLEVIQSLAEQNVSLFAFQEANLNFLNALKSSPLVSSGRFEPIIAQNVSKQKGKESTARNDYGVVLYLKDKYRYSEDKTEIVSYALGEDSFNKYIQRTLLTHQASHVPFFFVNSHVEFGKLDQIGRYLTQLKADHPSTPVIAAGDFNAGFRDEVQWSVQKHLLPVIPGFHVVQTPGFSHIDTNQKLDRYDLFVFADSGKKNLISVQVEEASSTIMTSFQKRSLR